MKPLIVITAALAIATSAVVAKTAKDIQLEESDKEELEKRRDIHKPGQMSEGYDRNQDEKQEVIKDGDPEFPIDIDRSEPKFKAYPLK